MNEDAPTAAAPEEIPTPPPVLYPGRSTPEWKRHRNDARNRGFADVQVALNAIFEGIECLRSEVAELVDLASAPKKK